MFEPDAGSVLWGMSPLLLVVGGLCQAISVATPHWLANSTAHWGLWTYCHREVPGECVGITVQLNANDHSWYRAVQGLEIAATVFVLAGLVTGLMRVNLGHRIWQTACGLSAIVAGIFGITGVIVYGTNYGTIEGQDLSWAFIFNASGGVMCLLSGPVLMLDALLWKT